MFHAETQSVTEFNGVPSLVNVEAYNRVCALIELRFSYEPVDDQRRMVRRVMV
jgi:hypothetical protein